MTPQDLGKQLRERREKARLTQAQVAERIGKPQNYVSRAEAGVMSVTLLCDILTALKVKAFRVGE